jgi:DNA topoisomerase-1
LGDQYRSLENEDQLFTVTLEEALELLSKPRARRARQAAEPLAELGADPVSGAPVVVREGRFGPYVTDGTVNASLRRGDAVETLTLERAAELLADRRARAEADGTAGRRPKARATGGTRARATRATGAAGATRATRVTKKSPAPGGAAAPAKAAAKSAAKGAAKARPAARKAAGTKAAATKKVAGTKAGATKAAALKAAATKAK